MLLGSNGSIFQVNMTCVSVYLARAALSNNIKT